MKRLIFVFLLPVLFFANVHAAEQYATFKSVRYQVRRSLGYDTSSIAALTDTTMNVWVREGIVVTNDVAHCNKVEWAFTTQYYDNSYDIDSNIIGIISVRWQNKDSVKSLTYMPQDEWYSAQHKTTSGQKDPYSLRPSYYDYTDDILFLYPTPTRKASDYDSVWVVGWRSISSLDTVTTLANIPEKYRPIVVKYVTWQAALAVRNPAAELYHGQFIDLVGAVNRRGAKVEASK